MNFNQSRFGRVIQYLNNKPWIIFLVFAFLILCVYQSLFHSFFESDEWPLFTFYLPLTRTPDGLLTAFVSEIIKNGALSGNQHIIPVASSIYFLNVLFFKLNFVPYAFIALLLHSVNSFLVFLLVRTYFQKKEKIIGFIYALIAGIFFAFSQPPVHAYTGAAPFYGQNVFSITFFLLCILFFKKALTSANKKYIYYTILFLFLALFTKETTAFLFILLPIIALIDKRVFSLKYLTKIFVIVTIIYFIIRFIVPYINTGNFAGSGGNNSIDAVVDVTDTETIVSRDTSIHGNIYKEIVFRSITFPIKMLSEVYFPFQTTQALVSIITPIVYPQLEGSNDPNRAQNTLTLINGPGNDLIVYILSICIIFLVLYISRQYYKNKEFEKLQALVTGLAIIILSALPLVMIVLAFPRWGYDTYFDSRHYYIPTVGAAIVFPFLLFGIAVNLSGVLKMFRIAFFPGIFVAILFIGWLTNSIFVLQKNMHIIVDLTGIPRREIIEQMQQELPSLPSNAVIHTETDGGGAYGPVLPFQTSVPQALSVAYYDKSPLPDSFFNKFIFDGKPEGYEFKDGRGFGYFASKKTLAVALYEKKFSVDDVYSFYYDSRTLELTDKTKDVRKEMQDYLEKRKEFADWEVFSSSTSAEKISFQYPPETGIFENPIASTEAKLLKDFTLINPAFNGSIKLIRTIPTFEYNEVEMIEGKLYGYEPIMQKASFDKYHYNDVLMSPKPNETKYIMKVNDLLIIITTPITDKTNLQPIEQIIGSINITL